MSRKRGLGKGLDALIPSGEMGVTRTGVIEVQIEDIHPNPRQPRTRQDPAKLKELAESIRQHGILQPLLVTPHEDGVSYSLIAGERRYQAAQIVGLSKVPVLIRRVDDQGRIELALVENLQRTDLSPLEAAEGYKQLAEDFHLSHDEIAERVGKSRSAITNTLRLLRLSVAVRKALDSGRISEGHARALLGLPTAQAQSAALKTILRRELSVRQAEELIRRLGGEKPRKKPSKQRPAEETDLEKRLQQSLGTKVRLSRGTRGGSLTIRFYSDEELNAIVDRLLNES
jgi:ParB family chromosome partitioning protein